jgi:hypothetical protein
MKYLIITIGLPALFSIGSCNQRDDVVKRSILLNSYERFENDTIRKYIHLSITKVYPAQMKCLGSENYANLYVAKLLNGESLYVFEYCKEVPKFVYDTTGRNGPIIDTSDIRKSVQDSVIIFVPKNFNIPNGVKYVIADLSVMDES